MPSREELMTSDPRHGDIIDPEAYSVAELRTMVFRGRGVLSRPLALALLGRKSYPQKVRDLTRLLMDEDEQPRLRNLAGQLLGRAGTKTAAQALERGLAVKNDLALRGVLQGLSLAGNPDTAKALGRLKRRKGIVGQVAARTAGLLGYRFGQRGAELAPPEDAKLLRVNPKRAVPIEIAPARGAQVTAAIAGLAAATPGLKLVATGAKSMRCAGRRLLLLFDAATLGEGLSRFHTRKTLAGVVAERKELEGTGWEAKYHLLTEPQKDGSVRLLVATARGVPVCTGTARIKGEKATFALRSVDRPGAVALDLQGTFEDGRVAFTQARSDQRRRPSPQPAPLKATRAAGR